jgi:WD40 repeat protein
MKLKLVLAAVLLSAALGAAVFQKNEKVQVDWDGEWYKATVLDIKDGKYLIHYDGYGSDADEWVGGNRIRKSVKRAPRVAAAGAKGASGFYLSGVETIWSCAYHPAGRYLAVGSDYGTVKLIDTTVFRVVKDIEISQSRVKSLAFNRTGTLLAAGCDDGTFQIIETASQKVKLTIEGFSDVTSVAFSPKADQIAASGTLRENTSLNTIRIFDLASGNKILEPAAPVKNDTWYAVSVAYNYSGTVLAAAVSNRGKGVELYDAGSGKRTLRIPWNADISCAIFTPDGSAVIGAAGNGTLPVWTDKGIHKFTAKWPQESAGTLAVFPDGRSFAAAGQGSGASVRVYSLADGKEIKSFGKVNPVGNMISISPDGKRIAVAYMVYGDALETAILSEYKN